MPFRGIKTDISRMYSHATWLCTYVIMDGKWLCITIFGKRYERTGHASQILSNKVYPTQDNKNND